MKKQIVHVLLINTILFIVLAISKILINKNTVISFDEIVEYFFESIFVLAFINLALGILLTIVSVFFRKMEGYGVSFLLALLACIVVVFVYAILAPEAASY